MVNLIRQKKKEGKKKKQEFLNWKLVGDKTNPGKSFYYVKEIVMSYSLLIDILGTSHMLNNNISQYTSITKLVLACF